MNLESRIKGRLTEEGMTIQRLAAESGISEPTIHAIFNRGDAKLSQLEKIAKALRTPLNFLLLDEFQLAISPNGGLDNPDHVGSQGAKVTQAQYQELELELINYKRGLETTRELMAGQTQIIGSLRDQLADKERTIQILLKQNA